jgi:YfiH family protein
LNLGFHVEDDPGKVLTNRERLSLAMEAPLTYFTFAKQVHGNHVEVVTGDMRGRGTLNYSSALDETDAMITNVPFICLTILVADCVPIAFYDPRHGVIGAAHAGWKGTVGMIGAKVVRAMSERFGSDLSDIIVGIGPSIGPCCYQVGPEVIREFRDAFDGANDLIGSLSPDGKAYLNLWEANRAQLVGAGVPDANIEIASLCTCCNHELFFSHRHDPGSGRFGLGIMLRDEACASCTAVVCQWCCKP